MKKKSPGVERQFKKKKQPKLVLSQMEMEVDRISYLPWNIVDKILSLLPLRDAVRTCILSSQWRYKWFLAADMVPRRLPTPCMELNYLSLSIDFANMDECLAALCILRSSPNLQELEIRVEYPRRAVTKKLMEDYQNIILNKLRFVKIGGYIGVPRVLDFINFLLVNSPMLERMTVGVALRSRQEDMSDVELLEKLLRFKRASANAEIIYMGP